MADPLDLTALFRQLAFDCEADRERAMGEFRRAVDERMARAILLGEPIELELVLMETPEDTPSHD